MPLFDEVVLRERAVIEWVVGQLKNVSQIERGRRRGVANCLVNLPGGLIAYTRREEKPSSNTRVKEQSQLPALDI